MFKFTSNCIWKHTLACCMDVLVKSHAFMTDAHIRIHAITSTSANQACMHNARTRFFLIQAKQTRSPRVPREGMGVLPTARKNASRLMQRAFGQSAFFCQYWHTCCIILEATSSTYICPAAPGSQPLLKISNEYGITTTLLSDSSSMHGWLSV